MATIVLKKSTKSQKTSNKNYGRDGDEPLPGPKAIARAIRAYADPKFSTNKKLQRVFFDSDDWFLISGRKQNRDSVFFEVDRLLMRQAKGRIRYTLFYFDKDTMFLERYPLDPKRFEKLI